MKDIVEISNQFFDLYQDKQQAKANYKDFITIEAIVKGDGGVLLRNQRVLFDISGLHARFKELANQKIVGTTDSSGLVAVHLMSNNLDKGTVTITIVDSAGQPLSASKSIEYEFIEDPDLDIAVAIEQSGAKADGNEQNIVAVSLTNSGQPLAYATVHAKVDGKALFVPEYDNDGQAITDSRGVARFYLIDGNNLHENVNFTAYYEEAQWLKASAVVPFSDAYNFEISAEVVSNFNLPDTSPNTVKIRLLNNDQIAPEFEIVCTLRATSSATFVKNGKKEITEKTDGNGSLTLDIQDSKVEKVQMEAHVALQPDKKAYADLEWQRYVIQLAMEVNSSLPDGIAQNKIKATVKNDGVLVPSEMLVFKIDERSKSRFVETGTNTLSKATGTDGTASAGIVSNSPETYPVVVALQRYTTLHSEINSTFGAYVLTVLEVKNNANGDGKTENAVKVSLTNSGKTVPQKKLLCEMKSKKAIFTNNHQYTSEFFTDTNGQAIISMVGTGSFQDILRISVAEDPSVFKEATLNWRKYTISQLNSGQKFVGSGYVTVQVKDNGSGVGSVDVVFPSPYNTTQRTDSSGKASANYYSSSVGIKRANVYLRDTPSVSTATSIEFVNRYEAGSPTKTYVPYGYDLTYRITDNGNGGRALSYTTVEAYLTMDTAGTRGVPDIWFENHTGNLTPTIKYYQTDGNGRVVIPIRYLLTYPPYWRFEIFSLIINGNTIANYGCYNY